MIQSAEAKSARQAELNCALAFMTQEIRTARAINQTGAIAADGRHVTLADVIVREVSP